MTTVTKKPTVHRKGAVPPRPPPAHEWDQQPKETDLAFATFLVYRDLPPGDRSYARVVAARNAKFPERQPIGPTQIERLSVLWKWSARVRLWDAMIAERSREDEIEDAVQAKKRRMAIARKLQTMSDKGLDRLIRSIEEGERVLTRDLIHAGVEGAKLERLELGESTANLKVDTTIAEIVQEAERVLRGEKVDPNPTDLDHL